MLWAFVPSDGYFDEKFTSLQAKFMQKLGFGNFDNFLDFLKVATGSGLDFVDDQGRKIIDLSIWDKYLPRLQGYIRGFYGCMIAIYNIKMVLYLIRGNTTILTGSSSTGIGGMK